MKTERKNRKKIDKNSVDQISSSKKRIFWVITVSLPVLFILLLETGLRIFDYGGNLDLFVDGPPGYEKYQRCNINLFHNNPF